MVKVSYRLLKLYIAIVIIFIFHINIYAQSNKDGEFEVVYNNSNLQFNNSPSVNLISGFKDKSILVGALDYTLSKPIIVYQSIDQGNSWNVIFEESPDSALSYIVNIVQTTQNNICLVVKGFARDSFQNWIPNYWVWFSNNLGQSWVKHNIGGLPLGFHFIENKGVFTSTTNDTTTLWTTEDYGETWKERQLPSNMLNTTPARLDNKEFLLFDNTNDQPTDDSLYYFSNIDLNNWEVKKLHENFGYNNFIAFNKKRILSAYPVWADIGSTALSYILETKNGGNYWANPINMWENYKWARRGLSSNSYIDSNNMVFLGPNVLYNTINGGATWDRSIWDDSINGGTRGVYMFYNSKLNKNQLVFPVTGSYIMRYTIPSAVGIKESLLSNKELELYPNPVKNTLNINLDQSEKIIGDVIVWSIEGKEVIRKNFNNKTIEELNVEGLKSGVYIIKLETVNGSYSNRFVK